MIQAAVTESVREWYRQGGAGRELDPRSLESLSPPGLKARSGMIPIILLISRWAGITPYLFKALRPFVLDNEVPQGSTREIGAMEVLLL